MKRAFTPMSPEEVCRIGSEIYDGSRRWRSQMAKDLALGRVTVHHWTDGTREPSPAAQRSILLLLRVQRLEVELRRLRGVLMARKPA